MHLDGFILSQGASNGGNNFNFFIVEFFSKFTWVYLLAQKVKPLGVLQFLSRGKKYDTL